MNFIEACKEGNLERVEYLLRDPHVNPQYANNEPLEIAMKHGHFEIAKLLLRDSRVMEDKDNILRIYLNHMGAMHDIIR